MDQPIQDNISDVNVVGMVCLNDTDSEQEAMSDYNTLKKPRVHRKRMSFGVGASAFLIHFSNVILALKATSRLIGLYTFKDNFNANPAEFDALYAWATFPWGLKFLWGILVDTVPIFKRRRRQPYLVLASLMCILGITLFTFATNIFQLALAMFLLNLALAFISLIAQAILIESTSELSHDMTSAAWTNYWSSRLYILSVALLIVGCSLDFFNPQSILAAAVFIPVILLGASLIVKESCPSQREYNTENTSFIEDNQNTPGTLEQVKKLISFFRYRPFWGSLLFMFVWHSVPAAGSAFLYFETGQLKFTAKAVSTLAIVSVLSGAIAVSLFGNVASRVSYKKFLFWATIITSLLSITPIIVIFRWNRLVGIPDYVFVLADDVAISAIGEILLLPTLVLAARLCPPGIEGMMYSVFVSACHIGGAVGFLLSGFLTYLFKVSADDISNLWKLKLTCSLLSLVPLIVTHLVPDSDGESLEAIHMTSKAIKKSAI
eukprot:GHVL01024559.1.p1 GENE.GHVL01024559.1~~GHVL01024559.1.p1  ORF type:complete len:491 (-),score=67.59 GHVL01024559.1:715-2187(-)